MWPDVLAGVVLLAVLAFPFASRRLRSGRVAHEAGAAVTPPVRPAPAGGVTVPVITDMPAVNERQPFACDNGVAVEKPEGDA